jgi:TonB family protein
MRRIWVILTLLALGVIPGRSQQAAQPAEEHVLASELRAKGISPPRVTFSVDPEFSDEARKKHVNGLCLVSLIVDANGKPQNVHIARCTDPSFEENSLKAVAQFRFKPATKDGKPVACYANVEINFRLYDSSRRSNDAFPVRYSFFPPPGATSSDPDANGVYPLTKTDNPPSMTMFADEGYEDLVILAPNARDTACDIVMTISEKGKASDLQVTRCERPTLEKPVVQSLLKSKYKPGKVNGKAVAMRASIHLEYGGPAAKP